MDTAGSAKSQRTMRFYNIDVRADNLLSDIKPILTDLRPTWDLDELCTDKLSGGLMNQMVCVYLKNDEARDDAMVLRVYGTKISEEPGNYRKNDIVGMQCGYAAGCFPCIYATFHNGNIYKYIPGRRMNRRDFINPDLIPQFTSKLYNLHHVDVKSVLGVDRSVALHLVQGVGDILPGDAFAGMSGFIISLTPLKANDPKRDVKLQEILRDFPLEKLREENEYIRKYLNELPIPMCFSHCDLHSGNIVFNPQTSEIFFVDFEGAFKQNEHFDFAYFFGRCPFDEHHRLLDPDYISPAPRLKREYLISYRDAGYRFHGKEASEIPEDKRERDLELLTVGQTIMDICAEFLFMTHCVGLVNIIESIDMTQFFPQRKASYYFGKENLPTLAQQYKKLSRECGNDSIMDD